MAKKWYMITTISGKEEKVVESLKNRVIAEGMNHLFEIEDGFKVMFYPYLSPKELDKKNRGEDYRIKQRNLFPGYIFINMNMTNEAWFMVRNTQYVTGLVGSSGQGAKPTPVSNLQIKKMEKSIEEIKKNFENNEIDVSSFTKGMIVEVIDGPTKGQVGTILEINKQRQVAVVELILFERKTPTEIEYKNLKVK